MSRCNCRAPKTNMAKLLTSRIETNSKILQNQVSSVYIKIQYHVIYNTNIENISLEKIRAQHSVINHDFNQTNFDEVLNKIINNL